MMASDPDIHNLIPNKRKGRFSQNPPSKHARYIHHRKGIPKESLYLTRYDSISSSRL